MMSCIYEGSLRPVLPSSLLHANSAKSWVVHSQVDKRQELAPQLQERKEVFTFYHNGTFRRQQLIHLGSERGEKGYFSLKVSKQKQDTMVFLHYADNRKEQWHDLKVQTRKISCRNDQMHLTLQTLKVPDMP